MGKKSQEYYKCTKARVNKIFRLIDEGLFRKDACLLSGISRDTFYQWIREGKKHKEEGNESLERENSMKGCERAHKIASAKSRSECG